MEEEMQLPEELIAEILTWLPVKSLLRFLCVSKWFYGLIKSPNFINTHLHRSPNCILVTRLVFVPQEKSLYSLKVLSYHSYESLDPISPPIEVVKPPRLGVEYDLCEPCNGIVSILYDDKRIYLYNPATRERVKLPHRPIPRPQGWWLRTVVVGFGFDSITNGYKLVKIVLLQNPENLITDSIFKAQIYDLRTNRWREIGQELSLRSAEERSCFGVSLNGLMHWIVSRDDEAHIRGDGEYILSFDFSAEVFQEMPLPNIDDNAKKEKRLIVLHECLALFAYTRFPKHEHSVDIWVMQQYGVSKSWTKHISVGPLTGRLCPFLLWKDESILIQVGEPGRTKWLVSCTLDVLEMNASNIYAHSNSLSAMVYRESLLSIRGLMGR